MNEQTQLLLKDAEYLTCPEAELIPYGARLTALINLVRKLAEAVPTAYNAGQQDEKQYHGVNCPTSFEKGYTTGLESAVDLLPEKSIEYRDKLEHLFSEGFNYCRSQASSAINEEINKSKV